MCNSTPKQTVAQAPTEQITCEFARVLGVTQIPEGKGGTSGRVAFCRQLFQAVDKLSSGQALMVEFDTKRDAASTRTTIWKLAEGLNLPYTCKMMDTVLWVYKRPEADNGNGNQ